MGNAFYKYMRTQRAHRLGRDPESSLPRQLRVALAFPHAQKPPANRDSPQNGYSSSCAAFSAAAFNKHSTWVFKNSFGSSISVCCSWSVKRALSAETSSSRARGPATKGSLMGARRPPDLLSL